MAVEDVWHRQPKKGEADPPTCNHKGLVPSLRHGRGLQYRVRWKGHAESFRTKGPAQRRWLELQTTPVEERPADLTVSSLVDQWLATKSGLSPKGLEACQNAAAHVRRAWGTRLAAQIRKAEVQAWVGSMAGSVSLRRKALQCLSGAIAIGIDAGAVTVNPCRGVRLPKDQRLEARFLSIDELRRAAAEAGDYRTMVMFLGTTGLRIGECAALDVGDVDVARRRLRVRKSKTGVARDVPVTSSVLALLDLSRPADVPLFVSPDGARIRPDNWRGRVFTPAVQRAGLGKVRIHDLRHTAASLAIHAGADVKVVQRMLGHASAAMTLDVYAGLFDSSLDTVAARMNDLLEGDQ